MLVNFAIMCKELRKTNTDDAVEYDDKDSQINFSDVNTF